MGRSAAWLQQAAFNLIAAPVFVPLVGEQLKGVGVDALATRGDLDGRLEQVAQGGVALDGLVDTEDGQVEFRGVAAQAHEGVFEGSPGFFLEIGHAGHEGAYHRVGFPSRGASLKYAAEAGLGCTLVVTINP